MRHPLPPFEAVVLAGGAGRRLGGVDKAALDVGGSTLLERVLTAVEHARRTVVVGPERSTARPVIWAREALPGSGPAAALGAGMRLVRSPWVVVVACDLPHLTAPIVDTLRSAAADCGGAVLVDDAAVEQVLVGCWSTDSLRAAMSTHELAGGSVRAVLSCLPRAQLRPPDDQPPAWFDCDTAQDLARAREQAAPPPET